jgi:hypothetical protein
VSPGADPVEHAYKAMVARYRRAPERTHVHDPHGDYPETDDLPPGAR